MKKLLWSVGVLGLVLGCSEGRDVEVVDTGTSVDASQAIDNGNAVDSGSAVDVPATPTDNGNVAVDAGQATGRVVINEVRASGDDWVELLNVGTAPVDLGGFTVADTDTDAGAPRTAEALTFPAGTTLNPGQYLVVVADLRDAGMGLQQMCLMGTVATCFQANFGISAGNGETLYLLDRARQIVDRAVYAADAVPSGQTLGRLPNGTGSFAPNRPTPGQSNAQP